MSYTHHWTRTGGINAVVVHYTASIVREAQQTVAYRENSNDYTSANYIIDVYGRITAVIPEEQRAFTSSSWGLGDRDIDNRAITIECSCNYVPPDITNSKLYTESDETIEAVAKLLADIGQRYGIELWIFNGKETGNIHCHKWYASTPCPGEYLYSKLPEIAVKANALMKPQPTPEPDDDTGDNDMTDEERQLLNDTADIVDTHTAVRYETVDDLPSWYHDEIDWLVSKGYLRGTGGNKLDLSLDMTRLYTVMARALEDCTTQMVNLSAKLAESEKSNKALSKLVATYSTRISELESRLNINNINNR